MDEQMKGRLVGRASDVATRLLGVTLLSRGESDHDRPHYTPWQVQQALADVGVYVSLADLAAYGYGDRAAAYRWALAVRESDLREQNREFDDVDIPKRPQWLPSRDGDACRKAMRRTDEEELAALREYHSNWDEIADAPGEADDILFSEGSSSAEDLREAGWMLAASFEWLAPGLMSDVRRVCYVFRRDDDIVHGSGSSDAEALDEIRHAIADALDEE